MNTYSLDLEMTSSQFAYITDANQTGLDITGPSGDITIEAWVKLESLASTGGVPMTIVAKDDRSTAGKRGYFFFIDNADNKLKLYFVGATGGYGYFQMDEAFVAGDLGVWIHVGVSSDVSVPAGYFYKNGYLKASTDNIVSATGGIQNNVSNFQIGAARNTNPERYFDGKVDQVRVSRTLRDAAYFGNYFIKEISPDAYHMGMWRFENDYLDLTSNNNDLTASGSPIFSTDVPHLDYSQSRITTNI